MELFFVIIIILVCLFLEGFFSGSEIALVVADKMRIKNAANRGDAEAQTTQELLKDPRRFFSITLVGTNICTVTATTVLTLFIIESYGERYSAFALFLSPVILIFAEILPKSIYQHYADRIAKKVGVLLVWASYALYPLVWLLSQLTKLLLGGVKRAASIESRISREELMLILSSKDVKDSDMPPEERKMIRRVLDLSDAEVENIMIPLVEVEMLPVTADTDAALSILDLKGYSRLPIFEHRAYNIVGIVDVVDCIFVPERKVLRDVMKPVLYVPESMPIYELYETMQDEKKSLAVVVDEYGGATGLVTLEDLLEEVVGEIRDEYELGKQQYVRIGENKFLVNGRMEIESANEALGLNIPDGYYETVAGYLIELFGYIPENGEEISDDAWKYSVKNATQRAVLEILVEKVAVADESGGS